jgi:CPA2 family monovalent cation:H+ antiporter-2
MVETPLLIQDLTLILGLAAVVSVLFYKIRQPVILGFLLVGIISGPYTPGPIVSDVAGIKVWAEIGVIFLLFSMGLSFRISDFFGGEKKSFYASAVSLPCMYLLGLAAAKLSGIPLKESVLWGVLLSFSSSVVVAKYLGHHSVSGDSNLIVRILLVEDFVAIVVMTALSALASQPSFDVLDLGRTMLQLMLVVGLWISLGRFALPRLFKIPLKSESNELLVISAVAACFGLVSVASLLGYSVALAAFIVGSLLAEIPDGERLAKVIEPLRDIFGAVFFISMGMLLDMQQVASRWGFLFAMTLTVVVGKSVAVYWGAMASGAKKRLASFAASRMGNIGEFSIILASVASGLKLLPADSVPNVIAIAVMSMFLMPFLERAWRGQ